MKVNGQKNVVCDWPLWQWSFALKYRHKNDASSLWIRPLNQHIQETEQHDLQSELPFTQSSLSEYREGWSVRSSSIVTDVSRFQSSNDYSVARAINLPLMW